MIKRWLSFFEKKSPRRITLGIALLKGAKAAVGIFSVMIMARYFGITLARDQWVVAISIITALVQFAFGPMNETFRSKLAHIRASSEAEFRQSVTSVIKWMTLFTLLISLASVPFVDILISLFGYERGTEAFSSLRFLVLISLPILALSELTTLLAGVLNLYGVYFIPEVFGIAGVLVNALLVVFFAEKWGIYSLWLGTLLNLLVLFIVLWRELAKNGIGLREIGRAKMQGFKECFAFSAAMFLPLIFSQLAVLTERALASRIGVGNVSGLDYARKFLDVPLGIVTASIATVLGPVLANHFGTRNLSLFYAETARVARMMILGSIPLLLVLFVAPEMFTRVLLKRGVFDETAVLLTADLLRLFVPGIIGAILFSAMGQALIASGRLSRLVFVTIFVQGGVIAGNVFLSRVYQVYAFPLSWSLMHLLVGTVMLAGLLSESRRAGVSLLVVVFGAVLAVLAAIRSLRLLGFTEENAFLTKVIPGWGSGAGSNHTDRAL